MTSCSVLLGDVGKRRQFVGLIGYPLVLCGDAILQRGIKPPR